MKLCRKSIQVWGDYKCKQAKTQTSQETQLLIRFYRQEYATEPYSSLGLLFTNDLLCVGGMQLAKFKGIIAITGIAGRL